MRLLIVAATALALFTLPALAQGEPVLVGGEADMDACGSQGEVSGLKAGGFLAVRNGPGTDYAELDRLHGGDVVNLCDEVDGWYAVVYGDVCGVGTPILERRPYDGPCSAGWVSKRYVTLTAG